MSKPDNLVMTSALNNLEHSCTIHVVVSLPGVPVRRPVGFSVAFAAEHILCIQKSYRPPSSGSYVLVLIGGLFMIIGGPILLSDMCPNYMHDTRAS